MITFISYPFKATIFAKILLNEKLNGKEQYRSYHFPIHRIEDLVIFSKFWLREPHKRLIEIHIPTFNELKKCEPELIIKNKIDEIDVMNKLINEIDCLLEKYNFIYESIGNENIGINGTWVDIDWF